MRIYQIWNGTKWRLIDPNDFPVGVHSIKIQEVTMYEYFKIKGKENESSKNSRIHRSAREDANSPCKKE